MFSSSLLDGVVAVTESPTHTGTVPHILLAQLAFDGDLVPSLYEHVHTGGSGFLEEVHGVFEGKGLGREIGFAEEGLPFVILQVGQEVKTATGLQVTEDTLSKSLGTGHAPEPSMPF